MYGKLEDKIYIDQPNWLKDKGKEHLVCLLQKSLYGLKQSTKCWYKRFVEYTLNNGFSRKQI